MALEDEEFDDEEAALWRRTVDTLLERGAAPSEAIEGANLVLQSYRRNRRAALIMNTGAEREPRDDGRGSGTRRRTR